MSYFNSITQDVVVAPNNSSTANLNAGATFSGSATSTLGVVGIQVSLYTTQDCDLWVDQSPDGENWDISDNYKYYHGINNFGITVQAVNSYFRVRVTNNGPIATTSFRLQSVLCPMVEALPRSLTPEGHLAVAVQENVDSYGFGVEHTPMDEMRVITPYRLVGATFTGSTVDANYWTVTSASSGGSAVFGNAQVIITTGSSALGSCALQTVRDARYLGGASNKFRSVIRLPDIGVTGNIRRWGAFDSSDGAFFQLSGSAFSVVTRKTSVDTPVTSGSFNGSYGNDYILDTNVRTWEIYWTNSKVFFTTSGKVIHTMNANTTTWSDTMHLPARIETTGGSAVSLNARVITIYRLGNHLSQPTHYYHALGQTTGTTLKYGAGNVHSILVSGVVNNCNISLADGTTGSAVVMYTTGAMGANAVPFSVDLRGIPFSHGLRLVVTGANGTATVIYE